MEQTQEPTTEEVRDSPQAPDELIRPLAGRMLAGVSQGVSDRFGVPVWLSRVAFIVTAFAGGLGVALYIAGWAFIRSEDEADTPASRFLSNANSTSSWVGIALIALAALIVLGSFSFFSGEVLLAFGLLAVGLLIYTGHLSVPASVTTEGEDDDRALPEHKEGVQQVTITHETVVTETAPGDSPAGSSTLPPTPVAPTPPDLPPAAPKERSLLGRITIGMMMLGMGVLAIVDQIDSVPIDAEPRHYLAMALTILGLGLLIGSVVGRARWLIILGAILVPTMLFSPVFEYDWSSDQFDIVVEPLTFDSIETSYHQDIGNLRIDLTELDWNGETVTIHASMDFGYLEVTVPDDVAINGQAMVDIGRVGGPGRESAGIGDPRIEFETPGSNGSVILDLELDVGNIQVRQR